MRTLLIEMPMAVRGFTRQDINGDYTIVINGLLSEEARYRTLQHELNHIKREDFLREEKVLQIEKEARCD